MWIGMGICGRFWSLSSPLPIYMVFASHLLWYICVPTIQSSIAAPRTECSRSTGFCKVELVVRDPAHLGLTALERRPIQNMRECTRAAQDVSGRPPCHPVTPDGSLVFTRADKNYSQKSDLA